MQILEAANRMAHLTALSSKEPLRADIGTVLVIGDGGRKRTICSAVNERNAAGYVPIYSTFLGAYQVCSSLANIVRAVASAILGQQSPSQTFESLRNNSILIGRGFCEIVPILGNLLIYKIDQMRISAIEGEIKHKTKGMADITCFYANGRNICSSSNGRDFDDSFAFMQRSGARFA